jgi:hypothetical protein
MSRLLENKRKNLLFKQNTKEKETECKCGEFKQMLKIKKIEMNFSNLDGFSIKKSLHIL